MTQSFNLNTVLGTTQHY